MQTAIDLERWREPRRGVAYRRWVMIRSGLELLLRTRLFKLLVAVAWAAGLLIALFGFAFSQTVSTSGWLASLASHGGPRMEALFSALAGFVALYPDVCVGGIFTLIFWVHAAIALVLTLVALTVLIPRLITRDRASNALTIYLSRPLTTVDYLLGKLGTIIGVVALVWTGPLLFGWLVSMLFATNRDFIAYSLTPLGHALLFNGVALVALAAIALGVSTLGRTARTTVAVWIGLWILAGSMASAPGAPSWLKRASFSHDLTELRQQVFRPDAAFARAARELPLFNQRLSDSLKHASEQVRPQDVGGALAGLAVLVAASSFVFVRKLRPE